ncbi:MAG TPA: FtsX-like permease family protein [Dehalococcoidia bacterium]|nr:FtsX-like permease family protein [Dehalococcoidia bacterium]
MEKLFGIPIDQLMIVLLVIFGLGVAIMAVVAVRNRVIFKMALRNPPRRRAQTALIVLGLMLATLLFSASFTTGDTLSHSIRVEVLSVIGEIDVMVLSETPEASGRTAYFDQAYFETVREGLEGVPEVEGVAPLAAEVAPVVALDTGLNEPQVSIFGYAGEWMSGFDVLEDEQGSILSLSDLAGGQVYISSELASELGVDTGDTVNVYLGSQPAAMEVAGVYEKGANPAGELSLVMPLPQLQALSGNEGKINYIIITNRGDAIQGAQHTDAVLSSLEPLLEGSGLEAEPVKQDFLDDADAAGSAFSAIFLMFGQFSIAAGILLIFLIFVMLAAERKGELGIARAVGAQQGHIIRMFAFEGAIYALIAAAVGSLLGVAVGWGMVRIIAIALGQVDLELTFSFQWQSVIMAYTLGTVLTFVVVIISSWRISRLNIVRAIRDIPEPRISRKTIKGLILAILLPVLGLTLTVSGLKDAQLSSFMLGTSLIIIGLPLLARRFGLQERAAFTIAGLGLVVWWLLPPGALESILPEMQQGMEMFFLSGIMLVIGAVWAVIYNSDLLIAAMVGLFGRIRGLAPVLKIAVSYPLQNRFRTGITLAMFSLIVFTLIVMAFITHNMGAIFSDTETLSGGFDIRADTSYTNPIPDIRASLQQGEGVTLEDFEAIGSFNGALVKLRQEVPETEQEFTDFYLQGVDAGYTDSVTYGFTMMAEGYDSPREVWQALQEEPGTAVVAAFLVPVRGDYSMGGPDLDFQLEGFFIDDETLPEVYIQAQDARTGVEQRLRVIGVLDQLAFYAGGVVTSQETVNALLSQQVPPLTYMFRLEESVDAEATAKALEKQFLVHGMQAEVLEEEIRDIASINLMMNNLLQGFMGLGLVVGIAALGVIAARSVVERRKQIGVLRALGFQKGMVQLSFLLESSFIALLGIALGVALGAGLSVQIIDQMSEFFEGMKYQIPWVNIVVVVVIAYGASLLTTYLPARQAAKIYPAEALRFE